MLDERVRVAITHWAPRFVANGVPLSDFQDVAAEVQHWDDWCAAWTRRGAVHENLGREAAQRGRLRSAGAHLTTAAVCFHFGKFLFVHDREQQRATHERAVSCRTEALALIDPPGVRVALPFGEGAVFGNLRRPRGIDRPPVVVLVSGLDSAKEEMGAYEELFLERGLATLAFDGPGQGEAEYDLPIRGDWEVVVAAVLDALATRDDVDGDRVGIWGVSLGGYYAPRAAAFEHRVRACISLSGPYDWGALWDGLPDLTREAFRVRSHMSTSVEAQRHAGTRARLRCTAPPSTSPVRFSWWPASRTAWCRGGMPSGSPPMRLGRPNS